MSTPTLHSRRSFRAACGLALGLLLPVAASAAVPTGFVDELVTSVGSPTGLAFTPDGRLLITTQGGSYASTTPERFSLRPLSTSRLCFARTPSGAC